MSAEDREEGTILERERVLAILHDVGERHYLAPARRALREIVRRVSDGLGAATGGTSGGRVP